MSMQARRFQRAAKKFDGSTIADAIISDSFGAHDALPKGVPSYMSWYADADTNPNTSYTGFTSYGAVNVWGQVFAVQGGSPNVHVRLEAKNPQVWFLRPSGWEKGVESSGTYEPMGGAYYPGDFTQYATTAATKRNEGGGVYSCSLSRLNEVGLDAFHWWWDGQFPRIGIPADCTGITCCTDIRLVPDDGYATINNATFICSVDCDLFATTTTVSGGPGGNPGLPEARMKYVTGEWTRFYNTTLSSAAVRANPPPLV